MDFNSLCDDTDSLHVNGLHIVSSTHGDHKEYACTRNGSSEDFMAANSGNALSELQLLEPPVDSVPACYLKNLLLLEKECSESNYLVDLPTATIRPTMSRSATFPLSKMEMHDKLFYEQKVYQSCPLAESLPVHLKLVSALKGGRKKEGGPLVKLTVTWAQEVYDPPTTSLSHTVKGGYSRYRSSRSNKKSSTSSSSSSNKHKHKGKSSRSSSSDSYKKHHRKHGANSESRSKQVITRDMLPLSKDIQQSNAEVRDFAVVTGNDTKCGSSFLMKSLSEAHLPITEAT